MEIAVAMPDGGGDGDEPQKAEPEGVRVRADRAEMAGDERDGDAEQGDAEQADAAIVEFYSPWQKPLQHAGIRLGSENFRVGQIRCG